MSPFELNLEGAGAFGDNDHMRAVWAGVAQSEPLRRLAGKCETAARKAGLKAEARAYRPHVTLAYLRHAAAPKTAEWVAENNLLKLAGLAGGPLQPLFKLARPRRLPLRSGTQLPPLLIRIPQGHLMADVIRPRRSLLYMPASNLKAIDKARSLPCDGVILDLEDAVAPRRQGWPRMQAVEAVKTGGFGRREVVIRVNGLDTPWGEDDLKAAVEAGPDAILVPKINDAGDVARYDNRLSRAPGDDPALGDDRDLPMPVPPRRDRRGDEDLAPDLFRHGHQRSGQGDGRAPDPRTRAFSGRARIVRGGGEGAWPEHSGRGLQRHR